MITLADIKGILNITDTSQDALISLLIPLKFQEVSDYCNNRFIDYSGGYVESEGVTLTAGADAVKDSIVIPNNEFFEAKFYSGGDIYVNGSASGNNGFKVADIVTDNTLTLNTIGEFTNETASDYYITIHKVLIPKSLYIPFAELINKQLNNKGLFEKSETLPGGYSVTYKTDVEFFNSKFSMFRRPYL